MNKISINTSNNNNNHYKNYNNSASFHSPLPYRSQLRSSIPPLPAIHCSQHEERCKPLTIDEYEANYRLRASDMELVERVYYGGMATDQLRAALWPCLFGLMKHRGRFERVAQYTNGSSATCKGALQRSHTHRYIEHKENEIRWLELRRIYERYQAQWLAILPEQEVRFTSFRDRKSLIEQDVIRCDWSHPFYAQKPLNVNKLTNLLMTYMMYDFDIGYVQGMSDLAGPILYMYNGDIVKSFWVFVEVMKLFRRNFELTQKTIHFQLDSLYKLLKITDPIFAKFLDENDSSNCFFVFRAIVCQFKRELMKDGEDDYGKVLYLWDTIWSVNRLNQLREELDKLPASTTNSHSELKPVTHSKPIMMQPSGPFQLSFDPDQCDAPRHKLTETEIFVLALCISMIRRERDFILNNKLDGPDIHLHFIDPKLAHNLDDFIENAIIIYSYIKNDLNIVKLTSPFKEPPEVRDIVAESPPDDLLNDFLIINGYSEL